MEYLEFAKKVGQEASKILEEGFSASVDIEWKPDQSPLTVTDKKINSKVIERIREEYPDHNILGEEESYMKNDTEYLWVCDPIDGTRPFTLKIPTCTFSLALVKDWKPIVGVIAQPFSKELFWAAQGKGAFVNGKQIRVNSGSDKGDYFCVTNNNTPYADVGGAAVDLQKHNRRVYDYGSGTYHGALVAAGRMKGCIFGWPGPYDMAAAAIIIEEAGGKVTDLHGETPRWDKPTKGFVGSNGDNHQELLDALKPHLK